MLMGWTRDDAMHQAVRSKSEFIVIFYSLASEYFTT